MDAGRCAFYLSKLTFQAVGELFTQAQQIQEWLNTAAYEFAGTGAPVSWTTPLGKSALGSACQRLNLLF